MNSGWAAVERLVLRENELLGSKRRGPWDGAEGAGLPRCQNGRFMGVFVISISDSWGAIRESLKKPQKSAILTPWKPWGLGVRS